MTDCYLIKKNAKTEMNKNITIDNYLDNHYIHRSNWLRAAVLGANDGIISISSLNFKGATNNQKIFAFSFEKTRIMSC